MSRTSACSKCGKRYKTLTNEGLCYGCHINKYGDTPKTGQYKQEKAGDKK